MKTTLGTMSISPISMKLLQLSLILKAFASDYEGGYVLSPNAVQISEGVYVMTQCDESNPCDSLLLQEAIRKNTEISAAMLESLLSFKPF